MYNMIYISASWPRCDVHSDTHAHARTHAHTHTHTFQVIFHDTFALEFSNILLKCYFYCRSHSSLWPLLCVSFACLFTRLPLASLLIILIYFFYVDIPCSHFTTASTEGMKTSCISLLMTVFPDGLQQLNT